VLFVVHLLQPIDGFAIELFLNCEVSHRGRWRSSVPVLFAWREPDNVSGSNLLDGAVPALRAPAAGNDNEGLPQRMRVPGGSCARFESNTRADNACRIRCGE